MAILVDVGRHDILDQFYRQRRRLLTVDAAYIFFKIRPMSPFIQIARPYRIDMNHSTVLGS